MMPAKLKYGCNPHRAAASLLVPDKAGFRILNGNPSYIKADKWFLQQHPKILSLPFNGGMKKPEKANLVDQFLLWDQLAEVERGQMLAGLSGERPPLTAQERLDWIKQFQGICLSLDAYIPFRDNIDPAARSNVQFIAQAGGSQRDFEVTAAAEEYGIAMFHTGLRLFLH